MKLLVELLLRLLVRRRVGEGELAVAVDGHPVLGPRQVLGREPEVDRVLRDTLERPVRRQLRLARLFAAEHRLLRLADHLDVPERVVVPVAGEVEVVEPEGLLEDGRVLVAREREHGLAVVEHVVPADLVGAVGEPVRVLVRRRQEQELRRVRGAAGEHDEVGLVALELAVALDDDRADGGTARLGLELDRLCIRQQRRRSDARVRAGRRAPPRRTCRGRRRGSRRSSAQRTQALYGRFASFSRTPHGAWNGW